MSQYYFGWRRQQPDHRDFKFTPSNHVLAALPVSADLSASMGAVLDQGALGSCGPNAIDSLVMFDQQKQGLPVAAQSRLLTYYITRVLMGTVSEDSGVDNRTMLKALNQSGFCDESLWLYQTDKFTQKPPDAAFTAALPNRITSYAAVAQDLTTMKGTIASGFPFLYGFTVYESFEAPQVTTTGLVPMPSRSEAVKGGHDICFVGFDDQKQMFKFKNSWGARWGSGGYGWMPYAYATDPNLSGDFWVINAIPGGAPVPQPIPVPPSPSPLNPSLGLIVAAVDAEFRRMEQSAPFMAGLLSQVNRLVDQAIIMAWK